MATASLWSHRIVLTPRPSSAHEVREFVRQYMTEHGLPGLIEDVQVVATELATNSILHARTPFSVSLSCGDGRVIVKVRDASPRPVLRRETDLLSSSGRGLSIVACLSQRWGVVKEPEGLKSVWASFDMTPTALPPRW